MSVIRLILQDGGSRRQVASLKSSDKSEHSK